MDTSLIDLTFVPKLLRLPYSQVWSDYDAGADVLYLSFAKPQCANDSAMEEDGTRQSSCRHYASQCSNSLSTESLTNVLSEDNVTSRRDFDRMIAKARRPS